METLLLIVILILLGIGIWISSIPLKRDERQSKNRYN